MARKVRSADGSWRDGSAAPKHLPDHLRKLPGDYVTKEVADGERVHELDDPHIVESIAKERAQKEQGTYQDPDAKPEPLGVDYVADKRLNQNKVDEVRLRVIRAYVQTNMEWLQEGREIDKKPKHLWFPDNDVNKYELREGNAPADQDRPKHLRGLKLHVDIWSFQLPETIKNRLEEQAIRSKLTTLPKPAIIL